MDRRSTTWSKARARPETGRRTPIGPGASPEPPDPIRHGISDRSCRLECWEARRPDCAERGLNSFHPAGEPEWERVADSSPHQMKNFLKFQSSPTAVSRLK